MARIAVDIGHLDAGQVAALSGPYQKNLRDLETWFEIRCSQQGAVLTLEGDNPGLERAEACLKAFVDRALAGELNERAVSELLMMFKNQQQPDKLRNFVKLRRCQIRPKSAQQNNYIQNILKFDVNFGIGPAGTGKTYLAVARAVEALEQEQVSRLVLTRPAVEAGEKLGFLPGDLAQKVDPYLRPVYDALYEMLGFDKVEKLISRHVIEVAPLAYMRGRTLNNAFIILDEAQNTTPQQMKMFLTRVGFGSRAVITGDITQTDLPRQQASGLKQALSILETVEGVGTTFFSARDIVRHPLVQNIVQAYEAFEANEQPGR
jgi:phosphate starvation-inducible PhoH-like protein